MKQIGNLAVVCARRQDVLLQVGSEKVCVHVGAGPERNTLHAAWDDDDAIQRIVHELNFGRYAAGRNGLPCGAGKGENCMIKNLNQLRRTLREGTQLEILDHCRPECIGQIRNITLVNTQGFYSTVANQPDASANRGNGGRGPILWWGRAAHWQFADGVCSVFDSEQKHTEEELVMSFRVLEKEAA